MTPSRRTDTAADRSATAGRCRTRRTSCARAATDRSIARRQPDRTPTPTARSCSPGSTARPTSAAGCLAPTSPTFCSACRSRRTLQYGPGNVQLRGQSASLYLQDDWRKSAKLTLNARRPLRADLAVHRGRRPSGEPRRAARLHRRRPSSCRVRPARSPGASPPALLKLTRNNVAPRARRRLAPEAGHPSCAAATASATTPARTRRSRASSRASRRSPTADTRHGHSSRAAVDSATPSAPRPPTS